LADFVNNFFYSNLTNKIWLFWPKSAASHAPLLISSEQFGRKMASRKEREGRKRFIQKFPMIIQI